VSDAIHIQQLELSAHIGVPDGERAKPQRLVVNLTLFPTRGFAGLGDDVANTVDYYVVTRAVQDIAQERPRKLIETLAEDIASFVLANYPLAAVELELRKFILPDTEYVAVRIRRERQTS
jgi:FolB domain-containing protein